MLLLTITLAHMLLTVPARVSQQHTIPHSSKSTQPLLQYAHMPMPLAPISFWKTIYHDTTFYQAILTISLAHMLLIIPASMVSQQQSLLNLSFKT